MKRFFLTFLLISFYILFFASRFCFAIENPLSLPNNKMGVHILFPSEINKAANLINSNGGDWGYVTIPIQAGDRDLEKWQKFMDDAAKFHVVPIIRLATEGDYFNTTFWKKPTEEDVLDFANFLNSLDWPVRNRYIVVFNEVNRADEWEGDVNPEEYASLLSYTASVFKSLNVDFFIISGGLDNAAANLSGKYMNEYDFMMKMNDAVPGIFSLIDGLGSHSYPNPGFKQIPYLLTDCNVGSFSYEKSLADRLSGKNLPVFITETGWSKEELSEKQIGLYFKYTFERVWSNSSVVAVTPFLLQAGQGPFLKFSLINVGGEYNEISRHLEEIPKTKGQPTLNTGLSLSSNLARKNIPVKTFSKKTQYQNIPVEKTKAFEFAKWFLKLFI
jgi:hypothetical protein